VVTGPDLARVEQHWALARIFTPLRREERARLDTAMVSGEVTFRVVGPWALGVDDLGVLLALLRMGVDPARAAPLSFQPRTATGQILAAELDVRQTRIWDSLVVQTTLRELGRITGRNVGGANLRAIQRSLIRLAAVTVFVTTPRGSLSAHVLGWSGIAGDGKVRVALHPHVAAAVIGGPATLVDMAAWRRLDGEVARRLLVWLSAWLRHGETRTVGLDALAAHVWDGHADRKAAAKRRKRLVEALMALDALDGWSVVVADRKATIRRSRAARWTAAASRATKRGTTGDTARHDGRRGEVERRPAPAGMGPAPGAR
jgi:hypothetical protein